jgi:hypothetical protein
MTAPILHSSDFLMPANILTMNHGHGSIVQEILRLETLITNIEYLLTMPEVSDDQKRRLRPRLMEAQAELTDTYNNLELPCSA